MKLHFIVAVDKDWGIAKDHQIPWFFSKDRQYFRNITIGNFNNAVVMGRKTWDTLMIKPLNKRSNFIFSKRYQANKKNAYFVFSYDMLIFTLQYYLFDNVFIIGGFQIYNLFKTSFIDKIYITHIDKSYGCDLKFPIKKENLDLIKKDSIQENGTQLTFSEYQLRRQ